MNKLITFYTIHILISVIIAFFLFKSFDDPNKIARSVTLTTVQMIQEPQRSSTYYRGVFKTESGKYIDFRVSASTYATLKPGDIASFQLNKYESGDVDENEGNKGYNIIFSVIAFCYAFFGLIAIPDIITLIEKRK